MASIPPEGPYQPKASDNPEEHTQPVETPSSSSLEKASQSTADYANKFKAPAPHHNQHKKHRRWPKVLITVLVLGILGAGGYISYRLLTDPLPESNNSNESTDATATTDATETPVIAEEVTQESYTSTDLNLSLTHLSSWTVTDTKKDVLEIESPETELVDENGESVQGTIVVRIVPNSASMTSFPSRGVQAVRDSLKFAYASPAEGQRQESMLSFVNTTGLEDYMDSVYITGDNTYSKGDSVAKTDFATVEPIIGVEFVSTTVRNISLKPGTWETTKVLQEAFDILKSLNIQ